MRQAELDENKSNKEKTLQALLMNMRSYKRFKMDFTTKAELENHKAEIQDVVSWEHAKPFSSIPRVSIWELIWGSMPGGVLNDKSVQDMMAAFAKKHGDIFIMPGMFGRADTLITLNPDDFAVVFRNEGKWPHRRPFDTVLYHRQVHRKDFFQGSEGIIMTNGEAWAKVRTAINPILMQQRHAMLYIDKLLDVNDEFLARIREIRDPKTNEMPENFEDELNRMTLESVAVVALNKQLGVIRKNRDSPEAKALIDAIRKTFELAFVLEIQPAIWNYYHTKSFKEMMKAQDTLLDVCNKYINEDLAKLKRDADGNVISEEDEETSVLEKLLRIDSKMAVVMALDMISAGVDTTSSALYGMFLSIAKHPEAQQKLFDEIIEILPEKSTRPSIEHMRNLPYLRACIKESLRLYPVIPGTLRRLPVDVVLSGYQVPKGTDVGPNGNIVLLREKYVSQAGEFRPERWLRSSEVENKDSVSHIDNPFVYTPFGFGRRICAGKHIVNLEMEIAIARLVRNFHIEFNYPTENAYTSRFLNVPNLPMKFKFEERKE